MAAPTKGTWFVLGGILAALATTAVVVSRLGAPPEKSASDGQAYAAGIEGAAQRVLAGAERSFERQQHRPALDFYRGFELRYAGTETHAAYAERAWERMQACGAQLGESAEALRAYVEGRRALHVRWRDLSATPPGPAWEAYLKELPPDDGRRARIQERLSSAREAK
jgi:hypothetical protein